MIFRNQPHNNPLTEAIQDGFLASSCQGALLTIEELVHYKTYSKRWLPPAKSLWSQLNGSHQSSTKGRGMTFSEVRQYQPGDDIRQIDWRVTARTGKAHTKLFTEEHEKPVFLLIDLAQSLFMGSELLLKSVQVCHMASLLSWMAIANGDRVGMLIRTSSGIVEIKPTNVTKNLLGMLQQLIELHNAALLQCCDIHDKQATPQDWPISTLKRVCPKGSDIILLSDFSTQTDKFESSLSALRQHHAIRAIQIFDPLEVGDTDYRGTQQVIHGNGSSLLNFSLSSTRKQLRAAFIAKQQRVEDQLTTMGIPYSQISCGSPLLKQLNGIQQ
ncbi:DUF58 domain-containing protein [Vibrio sp. ZSDZ34]|uniref:DUF58 domain-containing protein n=1 Tax=Vibrio gelatinilyticus TaxID=2893468 RepID=A0A9X1W9X6_9VIBR|nr:DUF58 domain-containing protein [Vibrio gelatinilyticus]MCJ2376191.1 DUF58 domain-containing protein [Vibrio gelatinilyticus]